VPRTIADGLRADIGDINFRLMSDHVADVLVVSEEEIVAAMRLVWHRMKQLIEPSSATVLAAVLRYRERFAGKRVGLVVSGGNVARLLAPVLAAAALLTAAWQWSAR